jgi:hypothetical protein
MIDSSIPGEARFCLAAASRPGLGPLDLVVSAECWPIGVHLRLILRVRIFKCVIPIVCFNQKGVGVRQNTTNWVASWLRSWGLHVSAALLGHHQVTRGMIQDTIQYTGSSCGTYFYSYQRDLVVVTFCVTIAVWSIIRLRLNCVRCVDRWAGVVLTPPWLVNTTPAHRSTHPHNLT